jgi:enoyl-CoA hydratase/carnithine racemase
MAGQGDRLMGVYCEVRDRVLWATLDRPDSQNGIDESVLAGLDAALDAVDDDEALRAMVVTGAGAVFSVGLDLALLDRAFADLDYFEDVVARLGALLQRVERAPVPVVAAVNGLARAGAFELVLACDLVVVAREARLADHHLSSGVVPGAGATVRLPGRIGAARAREVLLTSRWLSADDAVDLGLAVAAVPRSELDSRVDTLLEPLRRSSRDALRTVKAQLAATAGLPLEAALAVEREAFGRYLRDVPTSREGYLAYKERRTPSWAL